MVLMARKNISGKGFHLFAIAFMICNTLFITAYVFPYIELGWYPWHMKTAPLMTNWSSSIDPNNVLPEYPRPQMVRATWLNLNGI
jgi:hypothetical protein